MNENNQPQSQQTPSESAPCPQCNGVGWFDLTTMTPCDNCNATGKVLASDSMTEQQIKSITFASTQGGYSYFLGQGQPKQELTKISLETRHIQGDPYDFYVGRTADGQIVFEANRMNASIVIEYQTVEP